MGVFVNNSKYSENFGRYIFQIIDNILNIISILTILNILNILEVNW